MILENLENKTKKYILSISKYCIDTLEIKFHPKLKHLIFQQIKLPYQEFFCYFRIIINFVRSTSIKIFFSILYFFTFRCIGWFISKDNKKKVF